MAVTIGIGLREFGRMTPAELTHAVKAFNRREEREWYRTAWLMSRIASLVMGKKAPSPEKLLGRVRASGGSRARKTAATEGPEG